jgi:hypothetical protein
VLQIAGIRPGLAFDQIFVPDWVFPRGLGGSLQSALARMTVTSVRFVLSDAAPFPAHFDPFMRRRYGIVVLSSCTEIAAIGPIIPETLSCDRGHLARRSPGLACSCPYPQHPKGNMTASQTPSSNMERRLAIARRLHEALVAQNPDRSITLCDGGGEVVAHHDPQRATKGPVTAS